MVIGIVKARLSIPDARSLKDKRGILRSMKDRARNRMNISVAEVGSQDLWKAADLAFVTVGADQAPVQKRISDISAMLQSDPRYVLVELNTEML